MLKIQYDGTNYHGFQRQTGREDTMPTIQTHVENAIERTLGVYLPSKGSGRTDSGVHALGQVMSVRLPEDYDLKIPATEAGLMRLINNKLPPDIRVKSIGLRYDDFHALGSSRSKTYVYFVNYGAPDVFIDRYSWRVWKPIDFSKLGPLIKKLKGRLFCAPFCDGEVDLDDPESVHKNILFFRFYNFKSKKRLVFVIEGEGFLHKMVRRLVGFLIDHATGRFDMAEAERIMKIYQLRSTYVTAPARGLFLYKVKY